MRAEAEVDDGEMMMTQLISVRASDRECGRVSVCMLSRGPDDRRMPGEMRGGAEGERDACSRGALASGSA